MNLRNASGLTCVALLAAALASGGPIVLIGNDTNTAASMYTESGTFLGHLGAFSGSTGTAFDGAGHAYVAYGNVGSSSIREFDGSGTLLNTITFSQGWSEDITFIANTLWVSEAFTGTQFHIDLAGNLLGSFAGVFAEGIATDGTFLYTSDGFSGTGVITQRTLAGVATGVTISTGFSASLSLGYDALNNTFWMGRLNEVGEFNLAGAKVGGFLTTADSNFFHDGIAVGDFGAAQTPEPASLFLLGPALAGLLIARRGRARS